MWNPIRSFICAAPLLLATIDKAEASLLRGTYSLRALPAINDTGPVVGNETSPIEVQTNSTFPFPYPYPDVRYTPWQVLNATARTAAQTALSYNGESNV
jgi:hypothetical protein